MKNAFEVIPFRLWNYLNNDQYELKPCESKIIKDFYVIKRYEFWLIQKRRGCI